jgi:hypothetical protein
VLHHRPGGERVEDAAWSWSSTPDRHLDTALQLAAAAIARLMHRLAADILALVPEAS